MPKPLTIILGPELYWLALYLLTRWAGSRNIPATPSGNALLEKLTWLTASLGVALAFGFLFMPGVNRWVMLGRLAFAAFIGLNACLIVICDRINYPELGRNSGLMAQWMLAAMLGGLVYVVCAIGSVILMWWTAAKWTA